jgi:tetratricopeptide (TPR) repeat protein
VIDHLWLWAGAVLAAVLLFHWIWFVVLPVHGLSRLAREKADRAEAVLKWINATPSLMGDSVKVGVRYKLMRYCLPQRRYSEMETLCRAMLVHRLPPGLESDVRRHLAEALDGLGRRDEAEVEHARAESCLEGAPTKLLEQLSRGKVLMKQDRHLEAIEALQRGLDVAPRGKPQFRVELMVQLMLASFHAGQPHETVKWAEQAIAEGAQGVFLLSAHRMAGLAYGHLGQLETAEQHLREALGLAASCSSDDVSRCLVLLAGLQLKRGHLAEARETCLKAAESPKARREALSFQAEIERANGQFEQALQTLRQARELPPALTAGGERRIQAVGALHMAEVEAEAGQAENAWGHLKEAVAELGQDPKLGHWCDATAAWVFALLDRREQALAVLETVESRMPEFRDDRGGQFFVHAKLAHAVAALGDFEGARYHWQRILDLEPNPVSLPTAWYFLGMCRRHLGDEEGAYQAFRQASALGIDTYHARLAEDAIKRGG